MAGHQFVEQQHNDTLLRPHVGHWTTGERESSQIDRVNPRSRIRGDQGSEKRYVLSWDPVGDRVSVRREKGCFPGTWPKTPWRAVIPRRENARWDAA